MPNFVLRKECKRRVNHELKQIARHWSAVDKCNTEEKKQSTRREYTHVGQERRS